MIEKFFGFRVAYTEAHTLKELMAKYYEKTYEKILVNIISGKLLHVDETEVDFRDQKGYIWVFTNLEEVFYF